MPIKNKLHVSVRVANQRAKHAPPLTLEEYLKESLDEGEHRHELKASLDHQGNVRFFVHSPCRAINIGMYTVRGDKAELDDGKSVPVVGEPLTCDECGAATDDPWHSSESGSRHFHRCDACHSKQHSELATLREKAAMVDELRKALQKACIGLAHASEANPLYQKNYEACEKALMAIAQDKGE